MKKEIIFVDGMSCIHCAKAVEESAKSVEGVIEAFVNLKGGTVEVDYDETKTLKSAISEAIEKEGYSVKN